ncbi:hypothetical protein [Actinokineospora terrae]|uniref:Uncharacterized protein n=1 Tax=Actinokineospora terrae TaxID=155974 RepID=A0A1H9N3Z4_9PSEU|nr:hypothetical protein [Actinokineospora terrae]SER30123.1 hypothetical protein SAMN04487818_102473 [Actinokineospora terrae]
MANQTGFTVIRKMAAATAAVMLGVGATLVAASPAAAAPPAQYGGGVDINGWCVAKYSAPWHAELRTHNAHGWVCQWGHDTAAWRSVDMYAACRRTYGPASTARYTDYKNPYSWYCT